VSAIAEDINTAFSPPPAEASSGHGVVFGDPFTGQLLALASRVARTEVTVLIGGPSGTGKEVLARFIHDQSLRQGGRFIAFNCACLPESMVEDLLFGHEKGAFTGAVARFEGFFEQADGGTLFLDEVGELPLAVQAKLLRVLQEREFTPLGSTRPQKTRFRLLAATNRNLKADVQAGRFREDLYYRLNIFPLQLKPLKQRPGDILPLARALVRRHRYICGDIQLDASAIEALHGYDWPGNVRELENVIQRAMVVADGPVLTADHLGLETLLPQDNHFSAISWATAAEAPRVEYAERIETGVPYAMTSDATSVATVTESTSQAEPSLADRRAMQEAELIMATLKAAPTKTLAAARLGISERTLRYKLARLREHGLMVAGT
jgi:two-component system response regulator FlrC